MSIPSLVEYIADPARKAALAAKTGANPLWLWQVAAAWRGKRASPALAVSIESATGGAVTKESLRPDIWPPVNASKRGQRVKRVA